jgi:hypothetical protein
MQIGNKDTKKSEHAKSFQQKTPNIVVIFTKKSPD